MKYLIFIFILISCCSSPNEPKNSSTPCSYPAGNRNFTWKADTIGWFPSTMGGVHAFADDDAYAGGTFVTNTNPRKTYLMLHWDGVSWKPVEYSDLISELGTQPLDITGDDQYMVAVGDYDPNSAKPGIGEYNNQTKKWKGTQFQTSGALRAVWTDKNGYFIAVGENGTIYSKDGYDAEWKYEQISSKYNFGDITGISKHEIYVLGHKDIWIGDGYKLFNQIWKYDGSSWKKLFDDNDSTGMPLKIPEGYDSYFGMGAVRCSETDELKLYLTGWESILYESTGQNLSFKMTNLSEKGLFLRTIRRVARDTYIFTPNDIWVTGDDFYFFHWDGSHFDRILIPPLPEKNSAAGFQHRFVKTKTGKLFIPSETSSSQVYVIVQGTQQ